MTEWLVMSGKRGGLNRDGWPSVLAKSMPGATKIIEFISDHRRTKEISAFPCLWPFIEQKNLRLFVELSNLNRTNAIEYHVHIPRLTRVALVTTLS